MKKLINDPYKVVDETISGILKAYPYHLKMAKGSSRALVRKDAPVKGKVAICTGGGSGHIPLFLGYVGPGLLDGVSIGNVFSSPSADDMVAATREIDGANRSFKNKQSGQNTIALARNYAFFLYSSRNSKTTPPGLQSK